MGREKLVQGFRWPWGRVSSLEMWAFCTLIFFALQLGSWKMSIKMLLGEVVDVGDLGGKRGLPGSGR